MLHRLRRDDDMNHIGRRRQFGQLVLQKLPVGLRHLGRHIVGHRLRQIEIAVLQYVAVVVGEEHRYGRVSLYDSEQEVEVDCSGLV